MNGGFGIIAWRSSPNLVRNILYQLCAVCKRPLSALNDMLANNTDIIYILSSASLPPTFPQIMDPSQPREAVDAGTARISSIIIFQPNQVHPGPRDISGLYVSHIVDSTSIPYIWYFVEFHDLIGATKQRWNLIVRLSMPFTPGAADVELTSVCARAYSSLTYPLIL